MLTKQWSPSSYGCAVDGKRCVVLKIRYHLKQEKIHIQDFLCGYTDDRRFMASVGGKIRRKALWVPLSFPSASDRNDVVVCGIDDGDGLIKGVRLHAAVESQLREVEHNKSGDYIRACASFFAAPKRLAIMGASAPRAIVNSTLSQWRSLGVLNPCVGSTHAGIANLFLALKLAPELADASDSEIRHHHVVGCHLQDVNLFCYLLGKVFKDSGMSQRENSEARDLIKHTYDWASEFSKKHRFFARDKVSFYLMGAAAADFVDAQVTEDASLMFFEKPWEGRVAYESERLRECVEAESPALIISAFGLALHGV